MRNLRLLLACVLVPMTILASTLTTKQGSGNPYCGKTGADYPILVPNCPEGTVPNQACISACKENYKASMVAASDVACAYWDQADLDWVIAVEDALDAYDACMASATTPAQRQACRAQLAADLAAADGARSAAQAAINGFFDSQQTQATIEFLGCASGCCHPG